MIEIFSAKLESIRRVGQNKIDAFWLPENLELRDITGHGAVLNIITSIEDAINSYEKTAALEMFNVVQRFFPDVYVLSDKYN